MEYLADTVALVRHLTGHPAIGREAARVLRAADAGHHRIYVSTITLMEVMYLSEAKRIPIRLRELLDMISSSINYEIVPVSADIVLAASEVDDVPELHDRIIVGTAKWLGVPLLTRDEVMQASRHVHTIW